MKKKYEISDIFGNKIKILGIEEMKRLEEIKWKEIKSKLVELEKPQEQLCFLHTQMAEYYQTLSPEVMAASGHALNRYPYLGKLFLDGKIEAEIKKIESISQFNQTVQISKEHRRILDEYANDIEDVEYQERICLLHSLGVFEYLKKTYQIQSSSTLGSLLEEILQIKKGTIQRTLDRIKDEDLLSKYSKSFNKLKKKTKIE